MRAPERTFEGYVFDLDGTVYLGDHLLPGAKATLDELERLSNVVFLTSKPLEMPADYAAKLTRLGVPARATLLVGYRLATDMRMAKHAGTAGALALTGATGLGEALASADRPNFILDGLAELLPGSGGSPPAAPEIREG